MTTPPNVLVALEHRDLVLRELERVGRARQVVVTDSELLGLTRLQLDNVQAVAERIVAAAERHVQVGDRTRHRPQPPADDPVGQVLWGLRVLFADRHAGWIPTMGRDRVVGHVIGGGEIMHGSAGDPRPSHDVLPPRGAGPGRGVRVGVLDTGLVPCAWLSGAWEARYSDVLRRSSAPSAIEGHAGFVAGLALTQAPGATICARRVLDGHGEADSWTVANAIVDLGRQGIDVLNLSLFCFTDDDEPPLALATAVDRLDRDVVVVAAAGNYPPTQDGAWKPSWPAALDDVVAVGATDAEGGRAAFSPDAPWVDVHAPGVDVLSTYLTGRVRWSDLQGQQHAETFDGFARWSGTSFAAALTSGAIAAATQPGRVSAREALADIRGHVRRRPATLLLDLPEPVRR